MEELIGKLNGFLDAAAGVVTEYAPHAVDAALAVIRIDAVFTIILSVGLIGLLIWLVRGVLVALPAIDDLPEHKQILVVGKGVTAFFFFIIGAASGAMFAAFTPYPWIAAFDPMLGLVYKAAQSAGLL